MFSLFALKNSPLTTAKTSSVSHHIFKKLLSQNALSIAYLLKLSKFDLFSSFCKK